MGCDACSSYVPGCACDHACYGDSCVCNGPCYGYGAAVGFRVQIDAVGTPDTFKWSQDGGSTWTATGVKITGNLQDLTLGVKVKFDNTTGHTLNDHWDFFAGDGVFAGERLIYYYKNYGGSDLLQHLFHPGAANQSVDLALQTERNEWNEAMHYTAYSYFRLKYDANAWKSIPDFTAVLKGRRLYDPRNGAVAFSRNPALVWLDFLTNARYGLGVPQSAVDPQSVRDAANWCDSNGFTFDGAIVDRQAFIDNLQEIMANFRGFTIWSEGVYFLKIFTDDAAVMALTEADVEISTQSFNIRIPGIPETPNVAKMTFADKTANYTAQYTQRQDLSGISYDGVPRVKEIILKGTSSLAQANMLAKYCLLRNQFNKEFSVLAHPRCFSLEPGDMVTITHEFPGWTAKKLRVKDVGYPQSGLVPLTLMDEDPSIYDETL